MHGRLKVKTTEEQKEEKRKEQQKKLVVFQAAIKKIFEKRKNEEYDTEALKATQQVLFNNPDFYTLWNYRKEILLHMSKDLNEEEQNNLYKEELSLTESCLPVNPKSYGTWHQRCWALKTMPSPDWQQELHLCNRYLDLDERNFHVWDYRRFVVKNALVSAEDELEYTMKKINVNFSNYSSWHYRSKLLPLVHPNTSGPGFVKEDKYLEELELVQNAAFTDPNDQSAWFYHRWLLGRGEKPLAIKSLYVNGKNCCAVLSLTQELMISPREFVFNVSINGKQMTDAEWEPSNSKLFSTSVWILRLPAEIKKNNSENFEIEVTFEKDGSTSSLSAVLEANKVDAWNGIKSTSNFRMELSIAASNILQQELDSCEQLQEFEPDNKWMLLTSVLLMRAIDCSKYKSEVASNLEKLTEIDSYRQHYYKDLRSKFVLEDVIDGLQPDQREIALTNQKLTSLYHMDHLTQITTLCLSNNHLTSLHALHSLPCLRKLSADSNNIATCLGIEVLKHLEYLSLRDNCIKSTDDLLPLTENVRLASLFLNGNPLCLNQAETANWIKENLKSLTEISI